MNDDDFDVYVIDLETTGLDGYPKDHIVEIGIAVANVFKRKVKPVYHAIINVPNIREIDQKEKCWVFRNTDLTVEMVENSTNDFDTVVEKVRTILTGKKITAYYKPFDFDKFLYHAPWQLNEITVPVEDIKDLAKSYARRIYDSKDLFDRFRMNNLLKASVENNVLHAEDAYIMFCPNDPALLKYRQTHRALDDAIMEGYILNGVLAGELDRHVMPVMEDTLRSILKGEHYNE